MHVKNDTYCLVTTAHFKLDEWAPSISFWYFEFHSYYEKGKKKLNDFNEAQIIIVKIIGQKFWGARVQ